MTVRVESGTVFLEGRCVVEDAEKILIALDADPQAVVDVSQLERLHLAAAQVLLACQATVVGTSQSAFISRYILPPR